MGATTKVITPSGPSHPDPSPQQERPTVYAQCAGGPRPCPWIACRYNLSRIHPIIGALIRGTCRPEVVAELIMLHPNNCAADPGNSLNYNQMAALFGLSHQRLHQIGERAMKRFRDKARLIAPELERAA